MLNYWIEIAIESKTALGNMYAFAAILQALTMPQVSYYLESFNVFRYPFQERILIKVILSADWAFERHVEPPSSETHRISVQFRSATKTAAEVDGGRQQSARTKYHNSRPAFCNSFVAGHVGVLTRWWCLHPPPQLPPEYYRYSLVALYNTSLRNLPEGLFWNFFLKISLNNMES